MSPFIAFVALFGLLLGPPPWVDRTARHKGLKVEPASFNVWSSSSPYDTVITAGETCELTFFAMSTERRPVRAEINGVEQLLDTAWTVHRKPRIGERTKVRVVFRSPVGGAVHHAYSCWEEL